LERNLLEITRIITDPKTYVRPFTSTVYQERRPDLDVQEYFCSDNDRTADEGHDADEGRHAE
jgi:galactose-1-phosphate uridylyltransferase